MTIRFPYARPGVTGADIAAVVEVLEGRFLTQGPQVGAFETGFAAAMGAAHAVACSSGTAGLHLACMAAGLGPDRGLLTTPVSFLATASAAAMCGAPVIFADVDPATGNLDPAAVRKTLRESDLRIGAITTVHLAGRVSDVIALEQIANEFDCLLIEDACHAPGAICHDGNGGAFPVGSCSHSDLAVFSFHAIKHIAMGEGGAVCTGDPGHARLMRRLGCHGMSRDPDDWRDPPEPDAPWYYEMAEIGWNYRLTDIQCALGRSQLARLGDKLAARRRIAEGYFERLDGLPCLEPPPRPAWEDGHAWHLYPVAIDFDALGKTRGAVMRELAARGIGTQVHYIPIYRQPFYRAEGHAPLPGAEAWYARTLSIPMYDGLDDSGVVEITEAIREVVTP